MKDFKAGVERNQGYYKSFQPNPINRKTQGDGVFGSPGVRLRVIQQAAVFFLRNGKLLSQYIAGCH